MKRLIGPASAVLTAAVIVSMFSLQDASAATITYTQDTADFTLSTLPTSSTNPTPTSVTGSVYAPGALGTLTGSIANQYRSPFENQSGVSADYLSFNGGYGLGGVSGPWSTLAYSSVEAGGSATYVFGPSTTLSILWGSPDSYNTLAFYDGAVNAADFVGSISSTGTTAGALGNILPNAPLDLMTYGHDLMTFTEMDGEFTTVVLSSSTNAFEFADLQAGHIGTSNADPTPLPGTLALFAGGLGFLGIAGRRRKKVGSAPQQS